MPCRKRSVTRSATGAAPAKTAPAAEKAPTPAAAATKTPAPAATAKPAAAAKAATTAKAGASSAKKETEAVSGKGSPRSVIGEVVDPACWIVNGAKGPSHKECAIACAKAGQVLGIVESKTQKLYMIATDKPGEDPNKGLIDYVGQIVLVKGRVYSRGGATGIKVTSVEPYSPTAAVAQ